MPFQRLLIAVFTPPAVVIVVSVLALLPSASHAEWPNDGVPICTVTRTQDGPAIVSDGAGGAIVTWRDSRSTESGADIYAQRVYASGNPAWQTNGVLVDGANGSPWWPMIAEDGAGGAIIVWMYSAKIFAQRISAAGLLQWPDSLVLAENVSSTLPQIVSDGGGGAFIAWHAPNVDIRAQHVTGSGLIEWTLAGAAVCTATGNQFNPRIVCDGSGGLIVAWRDHRAGSATYAQRLNGNGAALWTHNGVLLSVTDTHNNSIQPEVVSDGANGAIVTWDAIGNGTGLDVYAQRVSGSGLLLWTPGGVAVTSLSGTQRYSRIISDTAGGAILVWADGRPLDPGIYAQRLNGNGEEQWTANGTPLCLTAGPAGPFLTSSFRLVMDDAGGAIAAWLHAKATQDFDIYAQRIDSAGTALWDPDGVALCTAANNQDNLVIASAGLGKAIVAWEDGRTESAGDIYAMLAPDVVTSVGSAPPASPLVVLQNYPNPFSTETRFEIGTHGEEALSIEVFDVTGRRVRTLSIAAQSHEWRTVTFDGLDDNRKQLPAGVYFYRVSSHGSTVSRKMIIVR